MGGRGGSSGLSPKGGSVKFPELEGSEKQVAWAKDIRKKIYERDFNLVQEYLSDPDKYEHSLDFKHVDAFNRAAKYSGANEKYEEFVKEAKSKGMKTKDAREEAKKRVIEWMKKEYRNVFKTQKSAKWWIENR